MKRINLLPPEERAKATRERSLLYAILILVGVVVVLGLVYVKMSSDVGAKQDELDRLNGEIAAVQRQAAELRPYAQLQTQRTEMAQTAKAIYDATVPFSTILQELSLVIPENVRLTSLSVTVPQAMLPGAGGEEGGGTPTGGTDVTFQGETYEHTDVAEFMTRLGLIPQLMNITLGSSTTATATEGAASYKTFQVTASLRPYLTAPPTTTLSQEGGQ
jgi:Tfp pilus assembly protein PilN